MNENSAWLRERRRREQEEAERRYAETAAAEADRVDSETTTAKPEASERVQRTCSICTAAGLVAEARGHIAIGHDTWLRQQPAHLQAHFNGQGAPADLEPRLVKPRASDTKRSSDT